MKHATFWTGFRYEQGELLKIPNARIFLVGGMGASKFAPLVFGLYLSRHFGAGAYAAFVLLLNYSAVISSFASMGATPRILRASATVDPVGSVLRASLAGLSLSFVLVACSAVYWMSISSHSFFGSIDQSREWEVTLISFYCIALTLLSLTIPVHSHERNWAGAGVSGISTYFVAIAFGLFFGWIMSSHSAAIMAYVLSFCAASVLACGVAQMRYITRWGAFIRATSVRSLLYYVLSNVKASLFGAVFLCGFYYINKNVNYFSTSEDAALYSLAFQLFAISIYLPSVLGSILIPIISGSRDSHHKASLHIKSSVVYVGLALLIAVVVFALKGEVLALYHIDASDHSFGVLMLMQLSAVVASFVAVYIQRFTADGHFWLLFLVSILWFFSLAMSVDIVGSTAFGAAVSLLVAYGVAMICFVICTKSVAHVLTASA